MPKIGIFSGSFNPIHNGHLIMANYIVEHTDLDKVVISVTPQNPLKDTILDSTFEQRCEMVTLALKGCNSNIIMSSQEKSLSSPYYTINTLNYYKSLYPNDEICLIIGKDNLENFKKWYNYQEIFDNFKLYICNRPCEIKVSPFIPYNINNPLVDISSTFIRKEIKEGRNIDFYVPKEVNNFIKENNLYKITEPEGTIWHSWDVKEPNYYSNIVTAKNNKMLDVGYYNPDDLLFNKGDKWAYTNDLFKETYK